MPDIETTSKWRCTTSKQPCTTLIQLCVTVTQGCLTLCNVISTLFQCRALTLYQPWATLKILLRVLFHFQRQINVISTLIHNVETMLSRRWNVGWEYKEHLRPTASEKRHGKLRTYEKGSGSNNALFYDSQLIVSLENEAYSVSLLCTPLVFCNFKAYRFWKYCILDESGSALFSI